MKRLFIMVICMVFLIGIVSAFDFDNIKEYDETTETITIKNSFLRILPLDTVAEITLKTPKNQIILTGNDKLIAEFDIKSNINYNSFLKKMQYYNIRKGMTEINKSFVMKKKVLIGYESKPIYESQECIINTDGFKTCKIVQVGTEDVPSFDWIPLDNTISEGRMTIGIFADVGEERTEWIPTIFGVRIEEWASFTGARVIEYATGSESGAGANGLGQNFTIGTVGEDRNYTLVGIAIKVNSDQGTDGTCNYTLWSDRMVTPLVSSATDCAEMAVTGWHNISMPEYTLVESTTYWWSVLRSTGNADLVQLSENYSEGNNLYTTNGGSSWTDQPVNDMAFYVYGQNYTPIYSVEVSLSSPNNYYNTTNREITFNCLATHTLGTIINLSLIIDGSINKTIFNSTSPQNLSLEQSVYNLPIKYSNWSCSAWGSDGLSNTSSYRYFTISPYLENSQTFNTSTYETSIESFSLNLSYMNDTYSSISADLYYNGTSYTGTNYGSGSNAFFTHTIDIPEIPAKNNHTIYWQIGLTNATGTFLYNSSLQNQTVNLAIFNLCNATLGTSYINFTFNDEDDDSSMVAQIPYSSFNYWIGSGSVNKTIVFTNTTEQQSFGFCFNSNYTEVNVDMYVQYKNSTNYPQRVYNPSTITLTNSTTNQVLYLLSTSDGLYVTFQVLNSAEQPISGVVANASRDIGGSEVVVGQGTTGADGGVTFWLNPDYSHTFEFSKDGYDLYTTTITPTQTSYTVVLGGGETTSNYSDYGRGITYTILPSVSYLNNDTSYSFNFTIDSTYWGLDSFGINITNGTSSSFGSDSDTTETGGTVNINLNTVKNSTFKMTSYWFIEGNLTYVTTYWSIIDTGESSWSISYLISDFTNYIDDEGIYGLSLGFNTSLLAFIIIFISVGVLSYNRGMNNPAVIMGLIFALVFFFDVTLGWITLPSEYGAISHFPTFIVLIIFVGFLIKEGTR